MNDLGLFFFGIKNVSLNSQVRWELKFVTILDFCNQMKNYCVIELKWLKRSNSRNYRNILEMYNYLLRDKVMF